MDHFSINTLFTNRQFDYMSVKEETRGYCSK